MASSGPIEGVRPARQPTLAAHLAGAVRTCGRIAPYMNIPSYASTALFRSVLLLIVSAFTLAFSITTSAAQPPRDLLYSRAF